jgi:cyclohexanecarboxylate-CoA ligase
MSALPSEVVDDKGTVTCEELAGDVESVAAGLAARGVAAGDRVVVSLPNAYEFVVVHLAVHRLGAVTVNLPTAFRREVGQVIRMVDARLTVLGDIDYPRAYGDLREHVELAAGDLAPVRGGDLTLGPEDHDPSAKAWLAFTSGSTGTPRAAIHTRASLDATVAAMADRYAIGPEDTVLGAAPLGHAIGFCYALRLACDRGARLVLQRCWDPEAAVRLIDAERCTFAAVPTPFLADLVEAGIAAPDRLRHLLVGGAPVPRDHLVGGDRLFGAGVVSAYYGTSECGATLTVPPGAADADRMSSDGVAMERMDVRIVDEDGADVAAGEPGEMIVRGPQVAAGYWMNNDSDRQFLPGGWFATRDIAVRAPSGFTSVTGRMKDIIIRGAVNIVPGEVEEAVSGHRDVSRTALVGVPDRRLGERLVAVITSNRDAPSRDEVRAWLKECGLARSKWPDEVAVVDELPLTASGKLDRGRVRDELLSRTARGT